MRPFKHARSALTSDSVRSMIGGGVRQIAGVFGVNLYQYADDRRVLERTILPFFAQQDHYSRILFVGCAWYTQHYERFFEGQEYWTLEPDSTRRKFGSKRHVIDTLENLPAHFTAGSLDVILCNGLLGWGLNEEPQVELAFNACVDCLRPGGVFVLGWNDVAIRRPCRPEDCASLRRMQPFYFPPLRTPRYLTRGASRHTYDFYLKP